MIACAIFLLLLVTGMSGLMRRRRLTLLLFFLCWIAICLLFLHHASSHLEISL